MASSDPPKLIVSTRTPDVLNIDVDASDVGGGPVSIDVALATGTNLQWITHHGTTLLSILKTLIDTELATLGSSMKISFDLNNTTGRVEASATGTAGQTVTITWDAGDGSGTWLRNYLGFTDPSFAAQLVVTPGTTTTATRVHTGGLYPQLCLITNLPRTDHDADQVVPYNVTPQTTSWGVIRGRQLTIALKDAHPWTSTENEWTQIDSMLGEARSGRPMRLYQKRSKTTPHAEITEPDGYVELVADKDDCKVDMTPRYGNWTRRFNKKIYCYLRQG